MKQKIWLEIGIIIIFIAFIPIVMVIGRNSALSEEAKKSDDAETYMKRGDQFFNEGKNKFVDASIQYWEALRLNPKLAEAHFKLAVIYYEDVWNYEALYELGEVEKIDPNHSDLYLLMGKIYNRLGNSDKALESFKCVTTLQPENTEAHYYLGTIYQQKNLPENAILEYEMAVNVTKNLQKDKDSVVNSYLQLGRIHKTNKDYIKAEEMLKKALKINPSSLEVISELTGIYEREAGLYKSEQKFDEAAKKYEEIIKLEPNKLENIEIYMELGSIYRSKEQYDKAIAIYKTITKLDPMNFDAFSALKELEILKSGGAVEQQK